MAKYRFTEVRVGDSYFASIRRETRLSRYLSFVLIILLPFLGGYVGYMIGSTDALVDPVNVASIVSALAF